MKNLINLKLNSLYLILVILLVCSNVFSSELNTLLKNADLARGQIPGGITWTVHIKTKENSIQKQVWGACRKPAGEYHFPEKWFEYQRIASCGTARRRPANYRQKGR